MSMQLAMKPYVTVGVALVGASVIAVAPIAPRAELHLPAVNLTASIENPITVFTPVVNAAGDLIRETLQAEFADPFPILRQIFANQQYTVQQLLSAVNAGGAAIGELVSGLPAALGAAGAILRTGDINGAIDSLVASGLQPILNFILGVSTPLQAAFERPFVVGQELVGAAFEVGLAVTVALAQTFIGIGFQVGTTPVLQNLVNVTESIVQSIGTLNPINVINAVQNGIADILLNAITHVSDFMTQSVPYIRDVIVNALKAGQPAPTVAKTSEVATVPSAAADTLTISVPGVEAPAGSGGAPVVTPVSDTEEPAAEETVAEEEPAAGEPVVEQPVAEEEPAVEEEPAAEGESDSAAEDAAEDAADEADEKDDTKDDAKSDKDETASEDKSDKDDSQSEKDDKSDQDDSKTDKSESGSKKSDSGSSDSGSSAAA